MTTQTCLEKLIKTLWQDGTLSEQDKVTLFNILYRGPER